MSIFLLWLRMNFLIIIFTSIYLSMMLYLPSTLSIVLFVRTKQACFVDSLLMNRNWIFLRCWFFSGGIFVPPYHLICFLHPYAHTLASEQCILVKYFFLFVSMVSNTMSFIDGSVYYFPSSYAFYQSTNTTPCKFIYIMSHSGNQCFQFPAS